LRVRCYSRPALSKLRQLGDIAGDPSRLVPIKREMAVTVAYRAAKRGCMIAALDRTLLLDVPRSDSPNDDASLVWGATARPPGF
jgi:hypothetical protein